MKNKILSILLIGCLCIGLTGCGKIKEIESGTYKTPSIFNSTFNFNENGTYDITAPTEMGNIGKGTYELSGKSYVLKDVNNTLTLHLGEKNGIFYLYDSPGFNTTFSDGDVEYGLKFTADEEGRTDQKFEDSFMEGSTSGRYHVFSVDFNMDGTCVVYFYIAKSYYKQNEKLIEYKYEGTYTIEDSIVTLNYNDETHSLVIDGKLLHFYTLEK